MSESPGSAQIMPTALPPGAPLSASARAASEPTLGRTIKFSAIVHLACLAAIVIKSLVFPSKPVPYIPALRVDIVALPDVLKKDKGKVGKLAEPSRLEEALKEAEQKAKQIPAAKAQDMASPDEMVLKPKLASPSAKERQKKLKSALDRIKAIQKIAAEEERKPAPVGALAKGNQLSRGTSLSGDAREAAEASYYDLIRDRLQDNWALPVWVARQNLSAQVQIFLDGRGNLRGFQFVKVSGNPQFDEAVKRTISQSQPFPVPPKELEQSLRMDGILVGFPL